ncbi:MAG: hypothetical protein EHM32_00530, partial [Spirochaetales bacterium]
MERTTIFISRWITRLSPAVIIWIFVAFVFAAAFPLEMMAQAKMIVAANASYSAVNTAVAAAQPGDTVVVPPGQATWASQLIITKSLSLIGAGAGSTVITSGIGNLNAYLIAYRPTDFASNPAFRVSGFTFDLANSSHGVFLDGTRNTTSVLQTRCRIDHNTFTGAPNHALGPQAIHIGGIMGVVDNNLFDNFGYPIRNCWGPSAQSNIWWNNWNANLLGTSENMYFEDNTFTGVEIIMDCQYGNRYAFRYNTVTTWTASFPLLDIHGNHSAGDQYSSFGGEVYGNQLNDTSGMRLMDHRGGKLLLFMNNSTTPSWHIQVRDEAPDSSNPTTNPEPQYPNDSYFFLNRRNLTGSAPTIVNEGPWSDNPPLYGVPQENREFWNGNPSFNGTVGVGWGTLANRPTTCTVGVGYWATNQSTTNLSGMVGKNPTTPILGTLYVCTATNVWTAFYTPYTYPHPMRKTALTVTSPNGGEAWAIGSSQKITWTSTADIGNVKIEYSTDNGANYTTITSSTADTWSYNWTVPNVISSSCRVRVSAAGTGPADTSDSEFTIVQSPPVKIRLSRSRLTFAATTGGKQTPDQFVLINNIGQGTMHWTAEEAEPGGMLRISPTQGTGNGKILVGVNPEGFSPGLYTGYIRV